MYPLLWKWTCCVVLYCITLLCIQKVQSAIYVCAHLSNTTLLTLTQGGHRGSLPHHLQRGSKETLFADRPSTLCFQFMDYGAILTELLSMGNCSYNVFVLEHKLTSKVWPYILILALVMLTSCLTDGMEWLLMW